MSNTNSQRSGLVVTDPKGVIVNGRKYPAGTPLEQIPAGESQVNAWIHFKQVGSASEDGTQRSAKR